MQIKYLRHYPLSTLTMLAIVVLSLIPFGEMPKLQDVPLIDKWTHIVMYAGLCSVVWLEYLRRHKTPDIGRLTLYALLCPIAASGMLELAQEYLTTYRSGEWLDLLANSIGAFLPYSLGICHTMLRKNRQR